MIVGHQLDGTLPNFVPTACPYGLRYNRDADDRNPVNHKHRRQLITLHLNRRKLLILSPLSPPKR